MAQVTNVCLWVTEKMYKLLGTQDFIVRNHWALRNSVPKTIALNFNIVKHLQ